MYIFLSNTTFLGFLLSPKAEKLNIHYTIKKFHIPHIRIITNIVNLGDIPCHNRYKVCVYACVH